MAFRMLVMTFLVAGFATISFGQKDLAESATLEQCRNGSTPTNPRSGCQVVGGSVGWVTGNAGASNSNWAETHYLAYRMLFGGLGAGPHEVIIGYDVLKSGVHAIDYLGTYNLTETNARPCVNVSGTHCAGANPAPTSTHLIPVDPDIQNFPAPRPTMPATGEFTMWGGTITDVSYVGSVHVGEERQIRVTFTAAVDNPVLAWGGHVAWRGEWGPGNSAGGITGSPYHMRLIDLNGSGGNQDRSLSADAVLVPGTVQIVKRTLFGTTPISVNLDFSFSSTAPITPINFDGTDPDDGVFVLNTSSNPQTPAVLVSENLGAAHPYSVTEVGMPMNWSLNDITCVETGQVGFPAVTNTTTDVPTETATIIVDEGETIVCTFDNVFTGPTAAAATISGRVATADGTGIGGARMTLQNATTGEIVISTTNPFGYYTFENMMVGDFYILNVNHKRFQFIDGQRSFTLDEDLQGLNFTAMW